LVAFDFDHGPSRLEQIISADGVRPPRDGSRESSIANRRISMRKSKIVTTT